MRTALSIIAVLLITVSQGQELDLSKPPFGYDANGMDWTDTLTLGQRYGTIESARAAMPGFMYDMRKRGIESQWAKVREMPAWVVEAAYRNDDYIGMYYPDNGFASRCNVKIPHGLFKWNYKVKAWQGRISGGGTQGFDNPSPTRNASGGTTLKMDWRNWCGTATDTAAFFEDRMWGDYSLQAYMEGAQISDMKLLGEKGGLYEPGTRFVSCLRFWTRGENSPNHDLFIYNGDIGIELGGQVHATYEEHRVSIFGCTVDACLIRGGGHLEVFMRSTDNNPCSYHVVADNKSPWGPWGNGFILNHYGSKGEDGHAEGQARAYSKGGLFVDVEGGVSDVNVYGGLWSHNQNAVQECFARMKGNYILNVWGMSWFTGPVINTAVHDRNKAMRRLNKPLDGTRAYHVAFLTDYTGYWHGFGKARPDSVMNTCDGRMAPLQRSSSGAVVGSWNLTTCYPPYSITQPMIAAEGGSNPPIPQCTSFKYTVTASCPDGKWTTRTAVGSPSGCAGSAPSDSLSRACTITPPPSGSTWTSKWSNPLVLVRKGTPPYNENYCVEITPAFNAKQVVLNDFVPAELAWLRIVGTGTESLQLYNDGNFYWTVGSTKTLCKVTPAGPMVVNKKVSITIDLPGTKPISDVLQLNCPNGGAQIGSFGTMTLK